MALYSYISRAQKSGSKKPLVIAHSIPPPEGDSHPVEGLLQSIFDGLRQDDSKREKKPIKKATSPSSTKSIKKKAEEVLSQKTSQKKIQPRVNKPTIAAPEHLADEEDTIRLWCMPGEPSSRILWLIEEIGGDIAEHLKLTIVRSHKDLKGHFVEEINPNKSTPTIRFGSKGPILWENGAIMAYILDHYKTPLAPETWTADNWTKHHFYTYWSTITLDKFSTSGVKSTWRLLEKRIIDDLGENDYLNGNEFSVTDIALGTSLYILNKNGFLKDSPAKLKDYYKRITEREAFVSSVNTERQSERLPEKAKAEEIKEATEDKRDSIEEKKEESSPSLNIEIPAEESTATNEEEESIEPKSPRFQVVETEIGFCIVNDNLDYSLLARSLYAIEKARVESGSSYSKMSNYDFAKLTFSAFYGPLIYEEKKDATQE